MPDQLTPEIAMRLLTRRYQATPEALIAVLCPLLVNLRSIDKHIFTAPNTSHLRASFTVQVNDENSGVLIPGRTGKFVPAAFAGDVDPGWREMAKGRIVSVDQQTGIADGEIYLGFGGQGRAAKIALELALQELDNRCFLEVDQYGVAAKALRGLAEYYLVQNLRQRGYEVVRMPECAAELMVPDGFVAACGIYWYDAMAGECTPKIAEQTNSRITSHRKGQFRRALSPIPSSKKRWVGVDGKSRFLRSALFRAF